MNKLLEFYENELKGKGFYNLLLSKSKSSPEYFNPKIATPHCELIKTPINSDYPKVANGDIRVDMPILCGNLQAKNRILILGLEPRHTDDSYNLMKSGNRVFATPFGIDKWFSKSKQSVYASAFAEYLNNERLFLFSDFVKEYEVPDSNEKHLNDQKARENFEKLFNIKYKSILEKEISLFNPTIIIGLGKIDITKKVPKSWLDQYNVNVISHPTHGNFKRMQNAMSVLLK